MGNRLNGIVMGIIAKKKKWTLTIQEGLPDDIYMKAAQALGEELSMMISLLLKVCLMRM